MKFAPLQIKSGYYFLSSALTIDSIATALKKENYFGMGISDDALFSAPHFAKMMREMNKPYLIGLEIIFNDDYFVLYALDEVGYRNLCKISTLYKANKLTSLDGLTNGLACVIKTRNGKFSSFFKDDTTDLDLSYFYQLSQFAKSFVYFYLGLDITSKLALSFANRVRKFAVNRAYETIAFPQILYLKKNDAVALDILEAIKSNTQIDKKAGEGMNYFMNESDYAKLYSAMEMTNTIKLIKSSHFDFFVKRGEMLHYPTNNISSLDQLKTLINNSLLNKGLSDNQQYINRYLYELKIIVEMGYVDYFLIVSDYVNYAKANHILVGPGRGSVAGCLIAYLLGITDIDPLLYNLQFERFLNPGRISMPDIDIDFMDYRRNEMVDYVKNKYGKDRVSDISTIQTLKAKGAIRDIGRIYNFRNYYIEALSKALNASKKEYSLKEAYRNLKPFKTLVDSDPIYLEIVSLANRIEGLPRQTGLHPSGVLINNSPLINSLPLIENDQGYVAQYEMDDLEKQGFLKMDFLSLTALTIIDECVSLINARHPDLHLDPFKIPYDNPLTYQLIAEGKVLGLFQLEGAEMSRASKAIKPNCFLDVVSTISIGRPGPIDDLQEFVLRKEGKKKFSYLSDDIKEVLEETYGVLIYQEQVSNIARKAAGFNPSEADLFRRAIAKKDASLIKDNRYKFISGALKNGYKEKDIELLFDKISKFAGYGFNKSHAVGYAIIVCQSAYLKALYPLEFYATILNRTTTSDAKFFSYINEIKSRQIILHAPNINISEDKFTIVDDELYYPLSEIKDINYDFVQSILYIRERYGPFKDYFDFSLKMVNYGLDVKHIERLIDAGAFDCFGYNRASFRSSLSRSMTYALLNKRENGQLVLDESFAPYPKIVESEDTPLTNIELEEEALKIVLSDNPLKYKQDLYRDYHPNKILDVKSKMGNFVVVGIIKDKKIINTKKGEPMAFLTIYDETGVLEITVFSNLFQQHFQELDKHNIIVVKGHSNQQTHKQELSYVANEIIVVENNNEKNNNN